MAMFKTDYPAPPMPGMPDMSGLTEPQPLSMLPTSSPDEAVTPGPVGYGAGPTPPPPMGPGGMGMPMPPGGNMAMGANLAMGAPPSAPGMGMTPPGMGMGGPPTSPPMMGGAPSAPPPPPMAAPDGQANTSSLGPEELARILSGGR